MKLFQWAVAAAVILTQPAPDAPLLADESTDSIKGFSFGSSDGNFAVNLKGVLQADSRTFFKDGGIKGNDGFLRRSGYVGQLGLGLVRRPQLVFEPERACEDQLFAHDILRRRRRGSWRARNRDAATGECLVHPGPTGILVPTGK